MHSTFQLIYVNRRQARRIPHVFGIESNKRTTQLDIMTTIVDFFTNTYGELQVDSRDGTLRQDINAPIFKVATEKWP